MTQVVRYLSHPQVTVDPKIPVAQWSLNDVGKARVEALAQSDALNGTTCIISSAETKAIETVAPIASALGIEPIIRPAMHENDRTATGFLPPSEFELVADAFFANPDQSIRGWETALDAQKRIVGEVKQALREQSEGDILFVGHGGVGTLLYCALAGLPISREHDQGPGGGGCYYSFGVSNLKPHCNWRPLEDLIKP